MAIPSAIQKQRDKLKSQDAQGNPGDSNPTEEGTQTQVQPSQNNTSPSITGDDDNDLANYTEQLEGLNDRLINASTPEEVAQARQEIAALKDKYSSLLGRLQAESRRANTAEARLHLQDDNVRTLESRATTAEKERDELNAKERERTRKEKLVGLDDGDDITDDELNEYDPKDIRMMRGLNKKQLVPVIKTLLAEVDDLKAQVTQLQSVGQTVSEIGKSHQALAQQAAASTERDFYNRVLTPHVSDWESMVKTSEWKSFLAAPDNEVDPSVQKGHLLAHYRKSKFVPGIVALFKEFQSRSEVSAGNGLGSLVTPAKTSADRTPTAKPKVKSSEYVKNLNAYTKSKSISREQWEKFKTAFTQAQSEGRVEDDAGIFNR